MNNDTTIDFIPCVVNHITAYNRSAPPCHGPASFWVSHGSWRKALPCCDEVARDLRRVQGFAVTSFDAMRAAGF